MKKYTKLNLGLLLAVIAIGTFLGLGGEQPPASPPPAVSMLNGQHITVITVKRTGRKDLIFKKQGHAWHIESPLAAAANSMRIRVILSVLQARSYARIQAGGANLARYGLANPAVTLKLDEHEFRFGGTEPLNGRRYLLYRNTIHLIDDGLFQQLQQPAEFFIARLTK